MMMIMKKMMMTMLTVMTVMMMMMMMMVMVKMVMVMVIVMVMMMVVMTTTMMMVMGMLVNESCSYHQQWPSTQPATSASKCQSVTIIPNNISSISFTNDAINIRVNIGHRCQHHHRALSIKSLNHLHPAVLEFYLHPQPNARPSELSRSPASPSLSRMRLLGHRQISQNGDEDRRKPGWQRHKRQVFDGLWITSLSVFTFKCCSLTCRG